MDNNCPWSKTLGPLIPYLGIAWFCLLINGIAFPKKSLSIAPEAKRFQLEPLCTKLLRMLNVVWLLAWLYYNHVWFGMSALIGLSEHRKIDNPFRLFLMPKSPGWVISNISVWLFSFCLFKMNLYQPFERT